MTATETITWTDFYTDPYPGMADTDTVEITETCHRCGGRGEFQAYRGIANGVCFACKGIDPTTTFTATVADRRAKAKKSAQGKATRARAKARKLAKNAAANEKWVQAYPALHLLNRDNINALDVSDWARHTLIDFLVKAESFGMSGKQAEFAASLITEGLNNAQFAPLEEARAAAEEAAKPQAPTGRQIIEGEVTSYYTDLKTFGYNETITRQITITTEEGWQVKVTAPAALIAAATDAEEAEFKAGTREEVRSDYHEAYGYTDNHPLIGRRVRLTATLEASPKREVAYGKRPTKSELV